MSPKDDRDKILARRRIFVASALAGAVVTGCKKDPQVCLNVAMPTEAGATSITPDAGAAAATDAGDDAGDGGVPRPRVCLSPRRIE